jgi:hypothetical protein
MFVQHRGNGSAIKALELQDKEISNEDFRSYSQLILYCFPNR